MNWAQWQDQTASGVGILVRLAWVWAARSSASTSVVLDLLELLVWPSAAAGWCLPCLQLDQQHNYKDMTWHAKQWHAKQLPCTDLIPCKAPNITWRQVWIPCKALHGVVDEEAQDPDLRMKMYWNIFATSLQHVCNIFATSLQQHLLIWTCNQRHPFPLSFPSSYFPFPSFPLSFPSSYFPLPSFPLSFPSSYFPFPSFPPPSFPSSYFPLPSFPPSFPSSYFPFPFPFPSSSSSSTVTAVSFPWPLPPLSDGGLRYQTKTKKCKPKNKNPKKKPKTNTTRQNDKRNANKIHMTHEWPRTCRSTASSSSRNDHRRYAGSMRPSRSSRSSRSSWGRWWGRVLVLLYEVHVYGSADERPWHGWWTNVDLMTCHGLT